MSDIHRESARRPPRAKRRAKAAQPRLSGPRRAPTADAARQHAALRPPMGPSDKKAKLAKKAVTSPALPQPRRAPTADAARQHAALQVPKALKRPAISRRRAPAIKFWERRLPAPNFQFQLPLPLETVGWVFAQLPLPLETVGEDPTELSLTFNIVVSVRSPLIVQFNIEGVFDILDPLVVALSVGDAVNDSLNVTFDVISGLSLRTTEDVQAPVAQVSVA